MGGARTCKDFKDTEYKSRTAMCEAYGKTVKIVDARLSKGWSLEDALTRPLKADEIKCKDHLNVEHESFKAMCIAYGKVPKTVEGRLKRGMSLEEALTKPTKQCSKKGKCKDYLDIEHKSFTEMCKSHGMNINTVIRRLSKGMRLEEALTKPTYRNWGCIDHLEIKYPSFAKMCKAYKQDVCTVSGRLDKGWSLEDALTKPASKSNAKKESVDCIGIKYTSFSEMCKAYNKNMATVKSRLKANLELWVALVSEVYTTLEFIGLDGKAYYKLAGIDELLTTRQIIEKYRPDLVSKYDEINPEGKYMPYQA